MADEQLIRQLSKSINDLSMRVRMLEGTERRNTDYITAADSIAAPDATVGWAKIYVDTADGILKVKFGNGTIEFLTSIGIDSLSDVIITTPATGNILQFNGTNWVNVVGNLDALTDVAISGAATGHILRHNGSSWVNVLGDLDSLSDVAITTPATGHILRHNGSSWVNVLGNLDSLSDVAISGVATGHIIQYSGSAWANVAFPITNITSLSDVNTSGPALGQALLWNGSADWVNADLISAMVLSASGTTTWTNTATTIPMNSTTLQIGRSAVFTATSGSIVINETGSYLIGYNLNVTYSSGSGENLVYAYIANGTTEYTRTRHYYRMITPVTYGGTWGGGAVTVITVTSAPLTLNLRAIREAGADTLKNVGSETSMFAAQISRDT